MDDLINEMQEYGFIHIQRMKMLGKAKAVLNWLGFIPYSKPLAEEQNVEWWQLNLWTRRN